MARNTTLSFFLKTTFACVLLASLIAFFTVHMLGPVATHLTPESDLLNHPLQDEASEGRRRRRRRNRILSSWKTKGSLPYRFNDYDVNNEEEDVKVTTEEEVKIRKQKEEIVTKSLALLQSQLKSLRKNKGGRKEDTRYSNVPTKEQIKESITTLEAEVETYRKAAGRDDATSIERKRQKEEKRIVKSIDVLLSEMESIKKGRDPESRQSKERKSQLRKSIKLLESELRNMRNGEGGESPKDQAEEEERPEEEQPEEEQPEEEQPEEDQPEEEQPAEDQEKEEQRAKEKIIEPNANIETADESPIEDTEAKLPKQENDTQKQNKKKKPLNILLLYADDWRHDTLGVAGHPIVETPFFDKLAKRAIRFTHNCVTTAVCWISRATLMTGQYMSRHKTSHPDDPKWYDHWEQTYPALLKQHGYHTGHVGKWNFKDQHLVDSKMYDYHNFYEGAHWPEPEHFVDKKRKHITERNEDDAMQFLKERPKDKPFCLTVAFFAPHAEDAHPLQYLPQPQSMDLYNDDTVPYPKVPPEQSFKRLPDFLQDEHQEGRSRYHWRFDEPIKYQNMTKNYFRLIHEVDQTSKRLYHELKRQGLLKDTIVIFTTDNGYFLSEHGMAGKWYPHEESIRVPLIIQDPRMDKELRGTVNDEFTLNIDLAPTMLGAAGIDVPDRMQGEDISQLYLQSNNQNDEATKWRDEFYYEHPWHSCEHCIPASEALVRKVHKLMVWPKFNTEQLFDLSLDPNEEYDLISSTEDHHVDIVKEMRGRYFELKRMAL